MFKTLIGAKQFCKMFGKVDGFIRVYDGTRYLASFGDENYNFIYSKITYLIGVKSAIRNGFSHNYAELWFI